MYEIILPKFEPNTEEAAVSQWLKKEGEEIRKGEPLFLMETTKAVIEVPSETSGWLRKILVPERKILPVLTVIALVGERNETLPDISKYMHKENTESAPKSVQGAGTRVQDAKPQSPTPTIAYATTQNPDRLLASPAAKRLAREHGVDLGRVQATGDRISEEDVQRFLAQPQKKRVLVVGSGMGGEVVASILANDPKIEIVGFLDDNASKHGTVIFGKPVLGRLDLAETLYAEKKFDALIVSITGNMKVRRMVFERLRGKGYQFINAIHPKAYISPDARIGVGNIVCAFVHIGCKAEVGDNNLVSAHSNIEHHNKVGSHILFGPHCSTSGDVHIGDRCIFGTGIFVQPHIRIGNDAQIASGSIILTDVKEGGVVRAHYKAEELKV